MIDSAAVSAFKNGLAYSERDTITWASLLTNSVRLASLDSEDPPAPGKSPGKPWCMSFLLFSFISLGILMSSGEFWTRN